MNFEAILLEVPRPGDSGIDFNWYLIEARQPQLSESSSDLWSAQVVSTTSFPLALQFGRNNGIHKGNRRSPCLWSFLFRLFRYTLEVREWPKVFLQELLGFLVCNAVNPPPPPISFLLTYLPSCCYLLKTNLVFLSLEFQCISCCKFTSPRASLQ